MIKIALGTKSPKKVKFVKEILEEIKLEAELIEKEVDSLVSKQPINEKETEKGAINRAKGALKLCPEADVGIGLEVGYHKKGGKYSIFCVAALTDKNSIMLYESDRFSLPKHYDQKLKEKQPLHKHLENYTKNAKTPTQRYIGEMLDSREIFIKRATLGILLEYIHSKEDSR